MLIAADTVGSVYNFCYETKDIWQFIGYVLFIFKIAIPILLIIFGMLDLGKAVVASDDKEIKNATTKLAKRAVAGVVIFFIPTVVGFIFSIVAGWGEVRETYNLCKNCIVSPTSDACEKGQAPEITEETENDKKGDKKTGEN